MGEYKILAGEGRIETITQFEVSLYGKQDWQLLLSWKMEFSSRFG